MEDVYRKMRNTLRYMLGALSDYDAETEVVEYSKLPVLEKWVLHRVAEIHDQLSRCIENYDLNKYFNTVYNFCANDLSSFYFDIRKDCLYCDDRSNEKRKAYRMVVYTLFQYVVRWIAPIMVFTAEDAWSAFNEENSSIHLEKYLIPVTEWSNEKVARDIEKVKLVRRVVNTALEIARKDKMIGSSLQAKITLFAPDEVLYTKDSEFWEEITIVSQFEISKSEAPENAFVSEDFPQIKVVVSPAEGEKCERCWKITKVDENKVCDRCQKVLRNIA